MKQGYSIDITFTVGVNATNIKNALLEAEKHAIIITEVAKTEMPIKIKNIKEEI